MSCEATCGTYAMTRGIPRVRSRWPTRSHAITPIAGTEQSDPDPTALRRWPDLGTRPRTTGRGRLTLGSAPPLTWSAECSENEADERRRDTGPGGVGASTDG